MQAIATDTSTRVSTRKKRAAPLDPQVADRLLDLLSTDDAFRRLFSRDPRKALEQVGFSNTTDLPSPAFCTSGITLASRSEIAAARGEIKTMFTSDDVHQWPEANHSRQTTPDLNAKSSTSYRRK